MITDDLGNECETEPASRRLRGDERIEQVGQQIVGDAWSVILDAKFKRQRDPRFLAWNGKAHAGPERRGKMDFAIGAKLGNGFGGILHKVQKHLNQLILIGQHRRQ